MAAARKPTTTAGRRAAGFLRPAVNLLNRLSYARKFALIGALVLAPLGYVTYLQVRGTTDQIVFNRKERAGVAFVSSLRELHRALYRFGTLQTLVLGGQSSFTADLREAERKLDEALAAVDAVDRAEGALLETSTQWAAIRTEWNAQKGAATADVAEAGREKVRNLIRALLNQVGTTSNLTLDPDPDSYYLQDAALVSAVNLTETLQRAAALGFKVARTGATSADDQVEIAGTYRAGLDQLRTLIDTNMKTAFGWQHGAVVRAALEEHGQKTDQAVSDYLKWVRARLLSGAAHTTPIAEIETRAGAVSEQVYLLQQKLMPQLDSLIAARVERYESARRNGLLAAALALGLLAYAFAGFFSSVQVSVGALAEATQRMIAGTEETFRLEAQDELGQVADSYNQINKALVEARQLRAQVESENRDLQGNILNLLQVVSDAAEGDLSTRAAVTTGAMGNVADAFNQMVESWQEVVREILSLLQRTLDSVAGIQGAAQEMAAGAGEQVTEIVTATESVSKVSQGIQRVSSAAGIAAGAGSRSLESAEAGAVSVQEVVRGMDGLRQNVQAGAKKIKSLGDRSMEITSIVGTIAKISDQTNMLALNRAIEAARAGEHGRGFSVVADLVRQLAERTATATRDIETLVRSIQTETNESVDAIEQQTVVVESQSRVVAGAGDALERIRLVSNESATLIGEIDAIAREQVSGVTAVARIMGQVSGIARRTQQSAESSVESAAQLGALATQLQERVNRFRL